MGDKLNCGKEVNVIMSMEIGDNAEVLEKKE
jgi:hypothetical protein